MGKIIQMLVVVGGLLPLVAYPATPAWQVVPDKSELVFTAIQNDAPLKGKFTQFDTDIHFDSNDLKNSKIVFHVNTNSVSTGLQDITNTLKTPDWLSTAAFPQATFETIEIHQKEGNHYQANGNLSIRNKTFPALTEFTILENTPQKMKIQGNLSFDRRHYGIGQGEWDNTNAIKDKIKVDFDIILIPL